MSEKQSIEKLNRYLRELRRLMQNGYVGLVKSEIHYASDGGIGKIVVQPRKEIK